MCVCVVEQPWLLVLLCFCVCVISCNSSKFRFKLFLVEWVRMLHHHSGRRSENVLVKIYRRVWELYNSWLRKMVAQQDFTAPVKQPEETGCFNWPMCAQDNCREKLSGLLISVSDTWDMCSHTQTICSSLFSIKFNGNVLVLMTAGQRHAGVCPGQSSAL